ncbi:unnamed protein product [Tilletia laevis]|nr:hypothetical protein CF336_g8679 [Tilletia laevis]CAD6965319.1 unnamed protein product [Tilletia laevis]
MSKRNSPDHLLALFVYARSITSPLHHLGPRPLLGTPDTLTEVAHAGDAYGLAGGGGDGAGGSGGLWSGGGCRGWRAVWNCEEIWASRVGFGFVWAAAPPAGQYGPTTVSIPRQEHLSRLLPSLDAPTRRQARRRAPQIQRNAGQARARSSSTTLGCLRHGVRLSGPRQRFFKQRQSEGFGGVGMRCASVSRQHQFEAHTLGISNLGHQDRSSAPTARLETRMRALASLGASSSSIAGVAPHPSHASDIDDDRLRQPRRHAGGGATSVLLVSPCFATTDIDENRAHHKWIGIATQYTYPKDKTQARTSARSPTRSVIGGSGVRLPVGDGNRAAWLVFWSLGASGIGTAGCVVRFEELGEDEMGSLELDLEVHRSGGSTSSKGAESMTEWFGPSGRLGPSRFDWSAIALADTRSADKLAPDHHIGVRQDSSTSSSIGFGIGQHLGPAASWVGPTRAHAGTGDYGGKASGASPATIG